MKGYQLYIQWLHGRLSDDLLGWVVHMNRLFAAMSVTERQCRRKSVEICANSDDSHIQWNSILLCRDC